jgi:hypothetical protein
MRKDEDKRAEFSQEAYDRGLKAEAYIDEWLKKLCEKYESFNHVWYNKNGDIYKPYDFAVFKGKRVRFLIECEFKGYIYESKFKAEGLDLIYRKVHRNYPVKCYYFMPIGSDTGYHYILYNDMETIKEIGYKKPKTTGRDRSKLESFWRVPFDKMKIIREGSDLV